MTMMIKQISNPLENDDIGSSYNPMETVYGKIYNGDATTVLKQIEDNSIDTVITDPPYGLSEHSENTIREVLLQWLQGNEDYTPNKRGSWANHGTGVVE